MTAEATHPISGIHDDKLAVAPVLLGPHGAEVAAATVEREGGTVAAIYPDQALYSPGRRLMINYVATVEWPHRPDTEELLVVTAGRHGPPDDAPLVRVGDDVAGVWRFPDDPVLPGVARAVDRGVLTELLADLGLDPSEVRVDPLVYRPTQRAVVRLSIKGDKFNLVYDPERKKLRRDHRRRYLYLKVVFPGEAAGIRRIHEVLGGYLTVPECHACLDEDGLLVLQGLEGVTLRDFIRKEEGHPPSGEELLELLESLAHAPAPDGTVSTIARRTRSHGRLLRALLPDHSERIRGIYGRFADLAEQPRGTVHGDFYDSQLLVDSEGRITGLLDLDSVATGEHIDDLASMLGRVWTSARSNIRGSERFAAYSDELLETFSRRVDRRELCMRVAGIVFGRATAPFRGQMPDWREHTLERLELAEMCVEAAARGELPPPIESA